ncbi:extracellular solute-binding protein [Paenibacillus flagellatus]|uniref:ABC transporter substrate-binding protein n=1 Tax=Paenibacillus flagellatus TaxID=2211139 RepID=A0A2V5K2I5_9BACL|nr:extracellular solute-binding protein [Paenibacillus flagellatus]PYI53439.1 ABC transporter substrate-binding protein [Paenibacillus flagellatus]
MKKTLRSISRMAAGVALALLAAVVGCSDKDSGGTAAGTGGTGSGGASAAEKRGSITVSLYDRGNIPAEEGTMDNNRWTKWVNANGPADVKFVPIPRWESLQKYNVLFASGSAPDLIMEFDRSYLGQLYNQKQLLPLDNLINQYSKEYKARLDRYPALKKAATMPDGKMYFLGRPYNMDPNHYLFIRADWLKKLNLQVPTTTDELLAVAKAFTENDPDGNGKKDTQGIALSFISGIVLNHMFGNGFTLFGTDQYPWMLRDDKIVHDWDRLKAAIAFQKTVYDAGYTDKDFVTDKNGAKSAQDWMAGKVGIYGSSLNVKNYETLKKNVPDAEIVPIALPKTEFGQFSPLLNNPIQITGAVNASAKDPAAVIRAIDFMSSDGFKTTIGNGLEGEHYKKGANGCPEPIDPEKTKKEVSYIADMNMLASLAPDACTGLENKTNPSPAEKDMIEALKQGRKAYVDASRPMPGVTHRDFLPLLPQDLAQINTNANKTILDMANKAIVGGSGYTAEQFIRDAKAAWEKAGGTKVDDFYDKWYRDNKDSALLMKDLYEMK